MNTDIAAVLAKKEARKLKRAENVRFIASVASKDAPGGSNGRTNGNPGLRKAGKGKIRRSRPKRLSNSKLEALRWEAFAAVIRERDADKGCFSCPNPQAESAGHIISRRKRATKYDERNVNGQCLYCNWADKFRPGYHDVCVSAFISKFGLVTYQELAAESLKTKQESRHEILASAWHYLGRMSDGPRKDKIRNKLAPLVPVEYGGTLAAEA